MKIGDKRLKVPFLPEQIEMELIVSGAKEQLVGVQLEQIRIEEPNMSQSQEDKEKHHASPGQQEKIEMKNNLKHPLEETHGLTERLKPRAPACTTPQRDEERSNPGPGDNDKLHMEMQTPDKRVPAGTFPLPKGNSLKWRRVVPERRALVVKDVLCLPQGHYLSQSRHSVPTGKEKAVLAAMGLIARMTINCSWQAYEMEERLASLFRACFLSNRGERFSFTYLQCLHGSQMLFGPATPQGSLTGEQVLNVAGLGPLYILSHHDYPQEDHYWPTTRVSTKALNRQVPIETPAERKNLCALSSGGKFASDLDAVLGRYAEKKTPLDVRTLIKVRRSEILTCAMTALRKPTFCYATSPLIVFDGETEGHEDPLREFFRLALLELQKSSVMEGSPGRLLLTYDLSALGDRKYYDAGVLIGWSLAHGGPGPHCLHPALYQLMCGYNPSLEDFSLSDVPDANVRIRLQELQSCSSMNMLSASFCEWVADCGLSSIYSDRSLDLPSVKAHVVKHCIYKRVASMISQFTEGLNSCGGLWDLMRTHREAFLPVMTYTPQPLTVETFKSLFTVQWSAPDSSLRAEEETAISHWETVLTMVHERDVDISFEELLAFITGANHLPPLGFPRRLRLGFYSRDPSGLLAAPPHASARALELFLPRGGSGPAELGGALAKAVRETQGPGRISMHGGGCSPNTL